MTATTASAETSPAAGTPTATPIVRVDRLAVSFDNGSGPRVQAVDGVRMTIYPRQTLAVVGESGCGKSVTAMSMLQLIPRPPGRFDRGEIVFQTEHGPVDLLTLNAKQIREVRGNDIAMIFQEPMTSLNPVYTVGDQIMEAILLHQDVSKTKAREIALKSMSDVGIPDPESRIKAYPHQFSGGMRQRVMIAMALACQPRLLLADEPTTALDVTIQAQILELMTELKQTRGMAVMLITHDLGVVAENSDVVCVMYAGRVVEYAKVFDLYDNPMHPYTRGLLASIPKMHERLDRLVTIREIVENEDEFRKLPGASDGVRPWWPWHTPPNDLEAKDEPAGDYYLQEVAPEHWVGVWRTHAVRDHESRPPDIDYRVPAKQSPSAS
ncbi:MAG: ABC transporter ATP-binding protein [Planctomycetota bacterium]|nr:MAG: ABC transporter ATP-binding protein [Planctomycetota bacterium]